MPVHCLFISTLLETAVDRGCHVLVAGIDETNAASIKLHEKHGFTHSGTLCECGFKFGRWLDLAFYQRVLKTPENPMADK